MGMYDEAVAALITITGLGFLTFCHEGERGFTRLTRTYGAHEAEP